MTVIHRPLPSPPPTLACVALRLAETAGYVQMQGGCLGRKKHLRYEFAPRRNARQRLSSLTVTQYESLLMDQAKEPCLVGSEGERAFWMFQDRFYCETDRLDSASVLALIRERERKASRRVDRAKLFADGGPLPASVRREVIPDDVKAFVWQRDGGRCTKCGTNENLEFDHIIPLAMNGNNTARNIQLLCGPCNRDKAGHLA